MLSWLGALTLAGTTAAPVIACTQKVNNNSAAQSLINKIDGAEVYIKAQLHSQEETTQTREELVKNSSITTAQSQELFFSGELHEGTWSWVKVVAKVSGGEATGEIKVTLNSPNPPTPNPAQAILNKITNTTFQVPVGTNPSVTNPQTVTAINTALQQANPSLTTSDLNTLSYAGDDLVSNPATAKPITVTSTVSATVKAQKALTVTIASSPTPSESAQDIINKIQSKDITLAPTNNPQLDNANTKATIGALLHSKNPSLTNANILTLTYILSDGGSTLKHQTTANAVKVTSTVQGQSANTTIQITYPPLPQPGANPAQDIINKIKNPNINLFYKVNPDLGNPTTISILLQQLKDANNTLLDQDLTAISFTQKTLIIGSPNTVQLNAKEGTYTAKTNITVTIPQNPSPVPQTNAAISALIKVKNMVVPPNFPVESESNPQPYRELIQKYNPWIPDGALNAMTFNGNLVAGIAVAVIVYINQSGSPLVVNTIKVKMTKATTPEQILANLKVLKTNVRTGTNPDTTNANTILALKQAILDDNKSLGADDVDTFTFSAATLSETAYQSVTITSSVSGQSPATKTIQVKIYLLLTPSGRVKTALNDESYQRNYYLNSNNNPDVNNPNTQQNLFNLLRWNNSATVTNIESSDSNMISFSGGPLVPGQAVPITVTITPRYGTTIITKTINVTLQQPNPAGYKPILAPFIDTTVSPTYSLKNLSDLNVKGATMAFVQSNGVKDGKIQASWGGISQLNIDSQSEQVLEINKDISDFQATGGNVAISFGGANGTPIWDGTTTAQMAALLNHAVDKFKLSRLDFDIEGAEMSATAQLTKLAEALNDVQAKHPNLLVSLTVAVIDKDSGVNPNFEQSLKAIGETLNKMPILNGMAMDYGTPRDNMAEANKNAINLMLGTASKLFALQKYKYTAQDLLKFAGFTPMLGINDTPGDLFTKYNAISNAHYANTNQVKFFGFWDANSDYPALNPAAAQAGWQVSLSNSGLWQEPGDFSSILRELFYQQSYS